MDLYSALPRDPATLRLIYNGIEVPLSPAPYAVDGVIMVPLRPIFHAMGAQISWNPAAGTVEAVRGEQTVVVRPGEAALEVDGRTVSLPAPVATRHGTTYLPLGAALGAFGGLVRADADDTVLVLDSRALALNPDAAQGLAYSLLLRVLRHPGPLQADLRVRVSLGDPSANPEPLSALSGNPAPMGEPPEEPASLGRRLESLLVGEVREGEARYRLDQTLYFGPVSRSLRSELYRNAHGTFLRLPGGQAPVESPGATPTDLGLPLVVDPERPWQLPLLDALQGLALGEERTVAGEPHRELILTYNPGQLTRRLAGVAQAYGGGAVSVKAEEGQALLLVRTADGWLRDLQLQVGLRLFRTDAFGRLLSDPIRLELSAQWEPATGPIDWLAPLKGDAQAPSAPELDQT